MKTNLFRRYLFFLIPLVGVLIVGIFLLLYGTIDATGTIKLLIHGIVMTTGIWLGCMVIVTWLWKKYPWEESPVKHLLLEIVLLLVYILAFGFLMYLLEKKYLRLPKPENLGSEIFITILITFFITSVHESVFFYQQWKYNFSKSVKLEKYSIEAKYEALRNQINPHFLFNSLNSLTSMVEGNINAVNYIQNLSEMLRYMLSSTEKELVLLRDELTILQKYLSLQMIRFPGILITEVEVPEKYFHYAVPPLALQMLVENCLKHNIISNEKPLRITIRAEKDTIAVTNNIQLRSGVQSSGQGLKNLTGRYTFFSSKRPEVIRTPETFTVVLPLLLVEL